MTRAIIEFNLETFIFAIFNFSVLVVGLGYLLFKPVRRMLADRRQRIQDELDAAEKKRQETDELRRQAEGLIEEARSQAFDLIEQARAESERIRQKKLAETKKEMTRLAERNRAELQHARDKVVEVYEEQATDDHVDNGNLSAMHNAVLNLNLAIKCLEKQL